MKLIKCHVENFGTLQNTDIDFESGLTVIKEDNGFGKSTLATFLKAMFYGLPQTTKRNLDENERKRYTPWQGGAFGGTLDFELGEKRYRIERFLAAKEKDDTCRVYDLKTNTLTDELTEDIGIYLFGIDAESFERSVYMPQTNTAATMSNSLRAKLTGLVENSDDISNFDNAVKALEKRAKEYSVANGARGAIAEKSAEISALESRRNDALAAAENLKLDAKELELLKDKKLKITDQIKAVRSKITVASDMAARAEQAKHRAEAVNELTKLSSELRGIAVRYPKGLPTNEQILEITQTAKMYDDTATEIGVLAVDTAYRDELERIDGFFHGTVPTEQEVADCRALINQSLKNEAAKEALAIRLENAKASQKPVRQSNVKLLLVLAAALTVIGGVTVVWQLTVGIILLALGVVLMGVTAFVYLKNMISNGNNSNVEDIASLEKDYLDLTERVQSHNNKVVEFTSRYSSDEPTVALEIIAQNLRDRVRLSATVAESTQKLNEKRDRAEGCKAELTEFFSKYGIGLIGGFTDRLAAVKNDIREIVSLNQRVESLNKKLAEMPELQTVDVDENAVADKDELIQKEKQLLDELNETEGKISQLDAAVRRLTAESDGLTEIEEQIESFVEQRVEMEKKLSILQTTLELLKTAKNDLSLKYLDRMTDGFKKYSAIITGDEADGTMIDTDLNIMLNRGGAARDKGYFSCGYCDMIDIAMRMALTDALYETEKPMLILDDPFVNLDDRRLKNAMELLKKLANERQIVYLTCHSSRC